MRISKRLLAISDMVVPCEVLADVGCDHALSSITAYKTGRAKKVIASDIREGPLKAARANAVNILGETSADKDFRFIISDGLKEIEPKEEIECIIISGMGGGLISSILREGPDPRGFVKLKQLVLGPQSELETLRHFLIDEAGLYINRERVVFDQGKYYFLMDARPGKVYDKGGDAGGSAYGEYEYRFGREIEKSALPVYKKYLRERKAKTLLAVRRLEEGTAAASEKNAAAVNEARAAANALNEQKKAALLNELALIERALEEDLL